MDSAAALGYSAFFREEPMERRLAAILAADVVGYTRLMRADESGTLQRITALREGILEPLIIDHRGRVVKLMGDGLLVEFASLVDAVGCAISWQTAVAEHEVSQREDDRFSFRIGVNLGDVLIEGADIHGDGVNIAARLEGLAEPGGICLSGDAYRQVRGKIAVEFEDLGERAVKNLTEPLRVYRIATDGPSPVRSLAATRQPPLPDTPSIAVLPFDNMSGDPEQEYFSDGISEDIITDLSKVSALFVIARNSSFTYKGEAVNIQHVSRELGVRYVVEGSVRKAGKRVRITAQLIDAETGGHVWADRYDRELDDIFAVQDEITNNIVGALQLALLPEEAELVAQAPTSNFQAYDFYLKGRQCFHSLRKAKFIEAQQLFERAIACDPKFARAYCGLADCGSQLFFWDGGRKYLEGVFEAIYKALDLEPDLAEAHTSMGLASSLTGDRKKAAEEFAIATDLDPNLYEAHYFWGQLCFSHGALSDAAAHYERAWKVSPQDPQTPGLLLGIYRDLNRDEDVRNVARKTLETGLRKLDLEPDNTRACMSCAFALVHLDRFSDAEDMVDRAIKNDPSDKLNYYNIACLYALIEQSDKALDFLEVAVKGAAHLIETIANDGDFVSLRCHPRFIALMDQ
jgi:adenylate cyclase